ncbi:MAG: radical SAM protein, partial [Pseudomonadota bacterium]
MIDPATTNGSTSTPAPLQLFLELTSACNLACHHCYVSAGEGEVRQIPGPLLQQLLLEFQALGGVYATFSGGEPTLHKSWKPAMRFARFIGLDTMLLTNGTTLRAQDIDFLRELDSQVAISLDAGNPIAHDAIRGEGTFEKTLARLEQLSAKGMGSNVTLCFTPMACNYRLLPEIVSLADRLGIGTVYLSLLEDRGRAKNGFGSITLDN